MNQAIKMLAVVSVFFASLVLAGCDPVVGGCIENPINHFDETAMVENQTDNDLLIYYYRSWTGSYESYSVAANSTATVSSGPGYGAMLPAWIGGHDNDTFKIFFGDKALMTHTFGTKDGGPSFTPAVNNIFDLHSWARDTTGPNTVTFTYTVTVSDFEAALLQNK